MTTGHSGVIFSRYLSRLSCSSTSSPIEWLGEVAMAEDVGEQYDAAGVGSCSAMVNGFVARMVDIVCKLSGFLWTCRASVLFCICSDWPTRREAVCD